MSLLTVQNLTFHIGDKTLYCEADFILQPAEHVGVTGHNGVGKSTLLKLLQAEYLPDSGDICWARNTTVGYLDQHAEMDENMTVRGYLQSAFSALYQLEAEMMAIYACSARCMEARQLQRAATIQTTLESQEFYRIDSRVSAVADGLGLVQFGLETPLNALSGGQRHKVMLAALLLKEPDVLLLDEPTNYLDTVHIDWLAEYLNGFEGAFMVVSHDRAFLNRVATVTCDIDHQKISKYKGNIEKAMKQKAAHAEVHAKQFVAQQKQIEKLEQFIAKNGAGVNASIANGRKKQLAKIERLAAPEQRKTVAFSFRSAPLNAQQVLATEQLEIGYNKALLPALSLTLARGEKVVIDGFNGIGKSTLLKTLMGELTPISGDVHLATGLRIGYFEQELCWPYPESTPLNIIKAACPKMDDKTVRRHLAHFGIGGKLALQPIATLSGGEQTKVKLCRLAMEPSHVLVLDEPTTHLDAAVKEALKQALMTYEGALIVVSHERDFVSGWLDKTIDIQMGDGQTLLANHQRPVSAY
ncbi:ABC-F family ATP-binding cassette domain-containing protein [Vibrio vulnificus]|nr:ABC-F family ATP-binding cassette domain-containing protein [Vibrio vulnificus]